MRNSRKAKMKSLIVRKEKNDRKQAQCCAKISAAVAGCHD